MDAENPVVTVPRRGRAHARLPTPLLYASRLAAAIAILGWTALGIDGVRVIGSGLSHGHALLQAAFLWFRYFTILTNIYVAAVMSVTAVRLWRRRPPPSAKLHAAALVYILVVCVTYEAVLRSSWVPHGIGYETDLAFHDVVPALTLIFWIAFAPKRGLDARFSRLLLIYPALYFVGTLVAGALGEGYPYNFLDVDKLGYRTVMMVGVLFLAIFYALGLATVTASRRRRLAG